MTESSYVLDNDWVYERERFDAIERNLDPGTIWALTEIGVSNGWNCLEVGAGGGSVTEWLCKPVGSDGQVTAIDLNNRFVDLLDYENLEVHELNVVTDDLLVEEYDLVHSRFILAHLPERDSVLVKMIQALRPGRWMLVEEPDFGTMEADPLGAESKRQMFDKGIAAIDSLLESRGVDRFYGRELYSKLNSFGLTRVKANGRSVTRQGDRIKRDGSYNGAVADSGGR